MSSVLSEIVGIRLPIRGGVTVAELEPYVVAWSLDQPKTGAAFVHVGYEHRSDFSRCQGSPQLNTDAAPIGQGRIDVMGSPGAIQTR